jgi:hypothetical protein
VLEAREDVAIQFVFNACIASPRVLQATEGTRKEEGEGKVEVSA